MSTTTSSIHSASSILNIDQAAAYLAIPKATLYTCRTRFGPRAGKFGGCLRHRRSDLDAWVADHMECLNDDPPSAAVQHDTSASHAGDFATSTAHSS